MLRRTVALLALLAVAVYLTPRSPTHTAEAVTTVPFLYSGSEQTFNVPAGVTQVHVVAIGAKGGDFSFGDALHVSNLSASITNTTGTPGNGGLGAKVVTDIPVPSGVTKFFVEVGGTGANADSIGTFNGGAPGGSGNFGFAPSGGGASDVRTVSNAIGGSVNSRLVVGGGGGGGGVPTDGPQGGGGGDAGNPASAGSDATSGGAGKGGGPGTLISGGSGGVGGIGGGVADGSSALIASFGGAGGGAGQSSGAGGGGGGGYFGGGGGGGGSNGNGAGGGGGAGSSFITGTALPGGTIVTAAPVDVTSVTISYVLAPTVSKAFATSPILVGATTDLTFSIANPNPADVLSAVGMTDSLPANILIAQTGATSVSASCGVPTITATINTSLVTLANATIPANSACTFVVKIKGVTAGTLTNTTSFVSSSGGTSTMQASAPITVQAPDTPTPVPTDTSTPTSTPTSTASPTPTSTASPTPTSTASPTPTPTATATPTPPSFVSPVESSPTPTPTATATPVFFPQLALPTISVPTFQNPAAGGLFNAPPKTPTPGGPSLSQSSFAGGGGRDLRLQAASVGQPSGVPVIRPPSTGNAGLEPEP